MTIRNCALSVCMVLMLACVASSQKVTGVWKLDEIARTGPDGKTSKITQPSMYMFTKIHYSVIYVNSDQPRSTDPANQMTAEQLLQTFVQQFIANAGTYEVKAGKLTMHPQVAKSPGAMAAGNWTEYSVKVAGNKMTMTSVSGNSGPVANPSTFTLTRVE